MGVFVDLLVLSRTIRIGWLKNAGTAIYLERNGTRFLVTAAHVVKGAVAGDSLMVRHESSWKPILIQAIFFAEHDLDVCVIVPATQWGDGLPFEILSAEVLVGEDVAFCGFPLGLKMEGLPDSRGWPSALLKAGTFSGAVKVNGQAVYLFDASANIGFSGGPIVRRNQTDSKLYVVGIVSGYKYDAPQSLMMKDEHGSASPSPSHYVLPNSGFMYGICAADIKILVCRSIG